jgi:four helix bundle protein
METGRDTTATKTAAMVKDFTDLQTWKLARELRSNIYKVTQTFPKDEVYGLASQMRRASVSITANIAEGFGRFSYRENIQFCRQSRASVYEIRDHLTTALDQRYISNDEWLNLNSLAVSVTKLLNGYIRSTQKRTGPINNFRAPK